MCVCTQNLLQLYMITLYNWMLCEHINAVLIQLKCLLMCLRAPSSTWLHTCLEVTDCAETHSSAL